MGPPEWQNNHMCMITESKSGSPLNLHDKPWSDLARNEMSPV